MTHGLGSRGSGGSRVARGVGLMAMMAGVMVLGATAHAAPSKTMSLIEPTHRAALKAVGELLTSDSPSDVAQALRVVRQVGPAGLEGALAQTAEHPDPELASAALDLLAQASDPRAVNLFEAAILSRDPALVAVATVWLPAYGERGLEIAARLLETDHPVVRHAALSALGQFPPSDAITALLTRAGEHDDARTARVAKAALRTARL